MRKYKIEVTEFELRVIGFIAGHLMKQQEDLTLPTDSEVIRHVINAAATHDPFIAQAVNHSYRKQGGA